MKTHWQIALIGALVILTTVLHYGTPHHDVASHIAHRELYFVPIILTGLWFGIGYGVLMSLGISLVYAVQFFGAANDHPVFWPVMFQILMFSIVAVMVGYLSERWKRQHERMLVVERAAALGDAARAVAYEMKDLLAALKAIAVGQQECFAGLGKDYESELRHLEQMVDILSSLKPASTVQPFAYDLNEVVSERVEFYRPIAAAADVSFRAALDTKGCPTRVNVDSLKRILDRILQNAVDASPSGAVIDVATKRGGDCSEIVISDKGQGIKDEDLPKIFKPFFSTKPGGSGLSLSASQKVMREMGGDIAVVSDYGNGAKFTVSVPREFSKKI
jgi:signal transduction histidine kinase